MILYWLIFLISLLFINTNAYVNKPQHLSISVAEHKENDINVNNSLGQSWKTTSEKTLIRVTRMIDYHRKSTGNDRQRRDVAHVEEIWGMAKKVAITVFVLVSVSILCCIVTTIYICIRCCCGGNNNRKRNQGFNTIPQPIVIHTSSPNYQPQFYQQQSPPAQFQQQQLPATQIWHPENHPMLPQPSAPPQPIDDLPMERPPAYEKIYAS